MIRTVIITKIGTGGILVSFFTSLSSICLCSSEECEEVGVVAKEEASGFYGTAICKLSSGRAALMKW